jgi:hypothetical protein
VSDADPPDLEDVARRLHDALHHEPPVPVSAAPDLVDELGRRSAARRRRKVAALTVVVACLIVGSAGALAASRHRTDTTDLAAGGVVPSTSTLAATTTSGDSYVLSIPPTSVVGIPTTTVPARSSLPPASTTSTTGPGGGKDCGSYGPSGWPTTIMFSPDAAQCLLDGFASGSPDTFHLVIADADYPAHQTTEDFRIVGVDQVQVKIDRTRSLDPPHTVVTEVCHKLSYQGDGSVYAFGVCG